MAYTKESVNNGEYYRILKDAVYIGSYTTETAQAEKASLETRKTAFQNMVNPYEDPSPEYTTFEEARTANMAEMDTFITEMQAIITLIGA